jgi:hypothetical protein
VVQEVVSVCLGGADDDWGDAAAGGVTIEASDQFRGAMDKALPRFYGPSMDNLTLLLVLLEPPYKMPHKLEDP